MKIGAQYQSPEASCSDVESLAVTRVAQVDYQIWAVRAELRNGDGEAHFIFMPPTPQRPVFPLPPPFHHTHQTPLSTRSLKSSKYSFALFSCCLLLLLSLFGKLLIALVFIMSDEQDPVQKRQTAVSPPILIRL